MLLFMAKFKTFTAFFGTSIYSDSITENFRHYKNVNHNPALVQFSWILYNSLCFSHIFLSSTHEMNARSQSQRKNCWRWNWMKNWEKQFWTADEEIFNSDTSLYSVSQTLNNFTDSLFFTSLDFSNDNWSLAALFVDNSQVLLILYPTWRLKVVFMQETKWKIPFKHFYFAKLPSILCSFHQCSESSSLTGNFTNCTSFKFCGARR